MAKPLDLAGHSSCGEFAEEDLVRDAQNGCLNCRNRLIERNADRLRSFIARTMLPLPDTEDIFQQTIFRALTRLRQFRGECTFLTWLCSIAVNEARQLMRKQRRVVMLSFDQDQLDKAFPNQEFLSSFDLCCRAEIQANVRRAVRRLQPTFRTVVELRAFKGLSLEDTAKSLRISVAATKSRYFRARKHLVRIVPTR